MDVTHLHPPKMLWRFKMSFAAANALSDNRLLFSRRRISHARFFLPFVRRRVAPLFVSISTARISRALSALAFRSL